MNHADHHADEAALNALRDIFGIAQNLLDTHAEPAPGGITLRSASRGPSAVVVTKCTEHQREYYDVKSSGIAHWKMQGMVIHLTQALGESPIRVEIKDGLGNTLNPADASTPKNTAYFRAEYPCGASLYWNEESRLNIHCPDRGVFDCLAASLRGPEKGPTP